MIEVFISVNSEEVIACYDEERKIHPNYLDGCRNKGLALESLKKYEESIA